ncbi:TetR/AcrR family transcriptional regulator [Rhodococcus sp. T2V]|uniref:TetR/AcrR family transcriptional regulator n=1 Tax=Rhodococcus sp. T2V TaxID=3034164 RepID=UPI0023E17C00|nr:TetR/AcrR family transcriptional regulator [Rhodococcus sp. T2V]MDF3313179.1 TetR/AcrR family transcriptional regulator [Rhodococcus sp. T2V]
MKQESSHPTNAKGRPSRRKAAAGHSKGNGGQARRARALATEASLVRSAREIFERDGFVNARILDIAENAEVAYGSFYTYFDSKEEIFRAVAHAVAEDMYSNAYPPQSEEGGQPSALVRIEEANRRYLESYARNAKVWAVIHQVATFDDFARELLREIRLRFVKRAAQALKRRQEDGLAPRDVDPELAADLLGGMIENYAYLHLALDDPASPAELDRVIAEATRIWARAIDLKP